MSPWRYGHITRTALGAALAGESSNPGRGNVFDLFIQTRWGELLSPGGTHGVSSPQKGHLSEGKQEQKRSCWEKASP